MRTLGRVLPTLLAQTQGGILAYFPETMGDERAKNNFANTARLVAIAYNARAVALVLESWVAFARPGRPLDPSVPPSQSPDRQECVVIQAESASAVKGNFLLIKRDLKGTLARLASANVPEFDEMKGRFSQIMPPIQPSVENRKLARQVLLMMGVAPERMGFGPNWN